MSISVYLHEFYNNLVTLIGINQFLYKNMDMLFEKINEFLRLQREDLPEVNESEIPKENSIEFRNLSIRFTHTLYSQLKKEMIEYQLIKNRLITIISDFEQYLHNSFTYILLKYPEKLSEKEITVINLLKLKETHNLQVIIEEIVEKELHDLFYEDFKEIFDYARKKLSLNHNISNELILQLNEVKLVRNLIIHNNGVVNHIFLFKTKKFKHLKLGEQIELSEDLIDELYTPIGSCMNKFDEILIQKFPELKAGSLEKGS